jgi:hypothetical protein
MRMLLEILPSATILEKSILKYIDLRKTLAPCISEFLRRVSRRDTQRDPQVLEGR